LTITIRARAGYVVLSLALLASPSVVRAQGGNAGSIIGYVFDQSGAPLAGIRLTATSPTQIGGSQVAYSNEEGFFRLRALFPGSFEVRAAAPKLRTVIQKDVQVGITAPAEVNVVMEVETTQVEEIKVVERAPLVSTTSANLKEVFDQEFIENTPYTSRDQVHRLAVNNIAGAIGGRVRGGAANQTLYTQDGFELLAQFPVLKSSAAFEIQGGGYGADMPTAPGGVVNLVTKTGSNRMEFQLNVTADSNRLRFFTDERDAVGAPTYFYLISPMLSGPIIKDKIWFFFATESHLIQNGRAGDVEGILPDPTLYRKGIQKGTFKVTWQVSPRHRVTSLNNFDSAYEFNQRNGLGIAPEAQQNRWDHRNFQALIWESMLSDNVMLRTQAGYLRFPFRQFPTRCRTEPVECNHSPSYVNFQPRRQEYGNNNNNFYSVTNSFQFANQLQWFMSSKLFGEHSLQLRDRFYSEQNTQSQSRPGDALYEYEGAVPWALTTYYSNDPRYEEARYGWFITRATVSRHTTTLSDGWRPTRHLTVTAAMSHIWASGANARGDEVVNNTALVPSLSAAWDATHDGRTVLRGSASQYVDVDILNVARHTLGTQTNQRCRWNEATQAFDTGCVYDGGLTSNTVGLPCGPSGINPDGSSCRQGVGLPRTSELTVGSEREVTAGLALSLDLVYRKFAHQYHTRETNRIWNKNGTGLDAVGGYRNGRAETVTDLGTEDGSERHYRGVSLGVAKREGRLKTHGSYTWSRLEGNMDALNSPYGSIPARDVFLYGPLPDDHRHELKLTLQYQLTSWASMGLRYYYTSGQPYNRLYFNRETDGFNLYRARVGVSPGNNVNDPADDRELRLPDRQDFNAQVRVNLLPFIGHRLDLYVDVLNVLGLRTATQIGQNDGQDFGVERAWTDPFRIRLGLNYRY
jgi:hypothetical protein